jgi:hypothetical protein
MAGMIRVLTRGNGDCGFATQASGIGLMILKGDNRLHMERFLLPLISQHYGFQSPLSYDELQKLLKNHFKSHDDVQQFLVPVLVKWHRDLKKAEEGKIRRTSLTDSWAELLYLAKIDNLLGLPIAYRDLKGQLYHPRVLDGYAPLAHPPLMGRHTGNHFDLEYDARHFGTCAKHLATRQTDCGYFISHDVHGYGEASRPKIAALVAQALHPSVHVVSTPVTAPVSRISRPYMQPEFENIQALNQKMNQLLDQVFAHFKLDDRLAKRIAAVFSELDQAAPNDVKARLSILNRAEDTLHTKLRGHLSTPFATAQLSQQRFGSDRPVNDLPSLPQGIVA